MKTAYALKVLALGAAIGLAGCSGMKTLQQDVEQMKAQMAKMQTDVQSARAAADAAAGSAESAARVANGAQSSVNQALSTAQSSQACCNGMDDKIERAFRQAVSK